MNVLISLDLEKVYSGGTRAPNRGCLAVEQGTVFGLLGPNGAGQTGAEVDAKSYEALRSFYIAAANEDPRMVEPIHRAGTDVNPTTEGGKTAFDFAIEGDHEDVVALLEKAGAGGSRSKPKKPP